MLSLVFFSVVEEGLYVSDAFHDVKIEVTEDGTKAAAATGETYHFNRFVTERSC